MTMGAPRKMSLLPVFIARPERTAQLREELSELERASRADPGCLVYTVFRDADFPDRFVLVEEWTDEAALDAHNAQPHVRRFVESASELLAQPFVVTRLEPVTAPGSAPAGSQRRSCVDEAGAPIRVPGGASTRGVSDLDQDRRRVLRERTGDGGCAVPDTSDVETGR